MRPGKGSVKQMGWGDRAPESKSSRKAKAEPLGRYLAGQVEKSEATQKAEREEEKEKEEV